jgi:O-antigen/teichoic acid export membrane protein
MALSAVTVFLSAFLLFLVQPIIAKLILPRFGGSVAVWATCLVFFQAALLLGYAFAHHLVRHDRSRALKYGHIALLLCSLALLPIVPVTPWPGQQAASPGR